MELIGNSFIDPDSTSHFFVASSKLSDFNRENLSPNQRYQKMVERIQKEKQGNFEKGTHEKIKCMENLFPLEEDKRFPGTVGIGSDISEFSKHTYKPIEVDYRSPSPISNKTTEGSSRSLLVGATIFTTTLVVYAATSSYSHLAKEIRTDIQKVFQDIPNDSINLTQLLTSIEGIYKKKEQSLFNRIFDFWNPTPIGYLLLTQGIVFDSQSDFKSAHERYEKALQYSLDRNLQNIIRYVYIRSLRLGGIVDNKISNEIDKLEKDSPHFILGQIEKKCFQLSRDEVFDEDDIPFIFKCTINEEIMIHPVSYTKNNHEFHFEYSSIKGWIEKKGTCPITRLPLTVDDLKTDDNLIKQIQIWNQTKLKKF